MQLRRFDAADVPALEKALAADTFHPGEWTVKHFYDRPDDKEPAIPKAVGIIEDSGGEIAFVRYTKTLRLSCVWNDGGDTARNARAIIFGIRQAVKDARASGFTELVIQTRHDKLATFFMRVMKMERSGDEYFLRF